MNNNKNKRQKKIDPINDQLDKNKSFSGQESEDVPLDFALKIHQLKDGLIVHIPTRDVRARDLSVYAKGHELTISGTQRIKKVVTNSNFVEYSYKRFFKTYTLPFSTDGYVMRYYYKSAELRITFIVNHAVLKYIQTEQKQDTDNRKNGFLVQIFGGLKNAGASWKSKS